MIIMKIEDEKSRAERSEKPVPPTRHALTNNARFGAISFNCRLTHDDEEQTTEREGEARMASVYYRAAGRWPLSSDITGQRSRLPRENE